MSTSHEPEALKPPPLAAYLEQVDRAIGRAEHGILVLLIVGLIGLGTFQFLAARFSDFSETWPIHALRNLVFLTAIMGASLAAQTGRMITMDFVARMLSPRRRVLLRMLTSSFVLVVCYLLFIGGVQGYNGPGLSDPMGLAEYAITTHASIMLPVGAVLIGLHYAIHIVIDAAYLAIGQIPPQEEGPAAH